jgi:phosphoglucomutase
MILCDRDKSKLDVQGKKQTLLDELCFITATLIMLDDISMDDIATAVAEGVGVAVTAEEKFTSTPVASKVFKSMKEHINGKE